MSGWLIPAAWRTCVSAVDAMAGRRLSVLIFHRVTPEPDPLFPNEMHAARFDALMAVMARSFQVMTIGQAHALWQAGRLPARALAITFDDGYADNADVALPILQRHGLQATFYIATGFLDGGRMWNDTVIEAIRACTLDSVDLECIGLQRLPLTTPAQRRAAIDAALPRIKYRTLAGREEALADVLAACGRPNLPRDLMMRSVDVQRMHAADMEIGGHTVRHPILAAVDDALAFDEIVSGRQRLQDLTQASVDVFAYPNGRPGTDFDHRHIEMVRRAGFRCAVTTAAGVVRADADAYQWCRYTPWDLSDGRWMVRMLMNRYAGRVDATARSACA